MEATSKNHSGPSAFPESYVSVLKKDENPLYVQDGAVLYVKTSSSKTLNGQYLATFFETNL